MNVASHEAWLAARRELLELEKAHTRRADELAEQRRRLPWVQIDKPYRFDTEMGVRDLAGLFSGCSQLLVYHFMFAPGWSAGCPICSFWTDTLSGASSHLSQRDTAMVWVSRAPLAQLQAYRRRMGWRVEWVSSSGSDFNFDFAVSFTPHQQEHGATYNFARIVHPGDELPGLSAFTLRGGVVYHTYSCYGRGLDALNPTYALLDRTANGRDEAQLPTPMSWVRRKDEHVLKEA